MTKETLVERLRKRAEIRRGISTRKSVQEGKPDRISDLLEEAADRIEYLELIVENREYYGNKDLKNDKEFMDKIRRTILGERYSIPEDSSFMNNLLTTLQEESLPDFVGDGQFTGGYYSVVYNLNGKKYSFDYSPEDVLESLTITDLE